MQRLKDSLVEIALAAQDDAASSAAIPLVTDPFYGERLYYTGHGFGRLWHWYYAVAAFFGWPDLQQQRLHLAIQSVQALLSRQHQKVQEEARLYQAYVRGEPSDAERITLARRRIIKWCEATSLSFQVIFKGGREGRVREMIFSRDVTTPILAGRRLCKNAYHLIRLEGLLQEELPQDLLRLAALRAPLEAGIDQKRFRRFVKKLNKSDAEYGIRALDRSLKAFVEMNTPSLSSRPLDLAALEVTLVNYQYLAAVKVDEHHMQKRGGLGLKLVPCNGRKIAVGNLLLNIDNIKIYKSLNSPFWVAIAPNQAYHRVKSEINSQHGWGVPLVEYIEIDHKGRSALIEQLSISLENYAWTSLDELSKEDRLIVDPILNVVKWSIEQGKTILNLSPSTLWYGSHRQLRSLKTCLKGEFNFSTWVDFIFALANQNLAVYRYLMASSGLLQDPAARFFARLVREKLNSVSHPSVNRTTLSVSDIAAASSIADGRVVQRAEAFLQALLQLKERIAASVAAKKQRALTPALATLVGTHITTTLNRLGCAGVIPPKLEEIVLQQTLATLS